MYSFQFMNIDFLSLPWKKLKPTWKLEDNLLQANIEKKRTSSTKNTCDKTKFPDLNQLIAAPNASVSRQKSRSKSLSRCETNTGAPKAEIKEFRRYSKRGRLDERTKKEQRKWPSDRHREASRWTARFPRERRGAVCSLGMHEWFRMRGEDTLIWMMIVVCACTFRMSCGISWDTVRDEFFHLKFSVDCDRPKNSYLFTRKLY